MNMVPPPCGYCEEFRFLEGVRDARRAAAYLCQFTRSEYKRPIGIFSNCTSLRPRLFLGWPNFIEAQNSLTYRGPLPLSCSCGREHTPFIGLSGDSTFRTSSSPGFGAGFWTSCVYDDILERSFVSLRDGDRSDLTPLDESPLLSPSLASAPNSFRSTYEAWKAGSLTKASLVDIASSVSIAAYFSAPHSSSLGSSISFVFAHALEGVTGFLYFCTSEGFYCLRYFLDSNGRFIARALYVLLVV